MLTDSDKRAAHFANLVEIISRLRGDGGCPWDLAQTPQSLSPYILEEVYEVLDAIESGDDAELQKELGDVSFLVVMLAQMANERGAFDIDDVLKGIADKMVSRHPHVFDPNHLSSDDEGGLGAWEKRKASERPAGSSSLDGVPNALPSLLRAHRISEKAAAVGFDWPNAAAVREKLTEEVNELDEAMASGDAAAIGEELGDVLFTLVNLGRHLPVGAEEALRAATNRFESRFRALESSVAARGESVHDLDAVALEPLWRAIKARSTP